jgi:hypothetical protein
MEEEDVDISSICFYGPLLSLAFTFLDPCDLENCREEAYPNIFPSSETDLMKSTEMQNMQRKFSVSPSSMSYMGLSFLIRAKSSFWVQWVSWNVTPLFGSKQYLLTC